MARPDPALLDSARYPFRCSIETRFSDLDVNQHVNNVAQARLLEEARVRFHHASGYRDALAEMSAMVASVAIEYLGQAYYPAPLHVHVGIGGVGRTSHTLCRLAMQEGRVVAYAKVVLVCIGAEGPIPLPAGFVEAARPWMLPAREG